MAQYRYLAADLRDNTIREEIPFTDVSYSRVLNRPGAFSASLPTRHAKALRGTLDPGRTAIYIERDGVPRWGGILWTARAASGRVQFGGEGFWSYFRRRVIGATKTYTSTDQLAIARDLIDYAQGIFGGNLGVVVGSETSGVLRDRTYFDYELKNIGEAVEQLSEVINGFDFGIDISKSGESFVKTFRLDYPMRGRSTEFVFDLTRNIESVEWGIDATKQANKVWAIGAGEEDDQLQVSVTNTSLLGISDPLLEDVLTLKDVSVVDTLVGHAQAEIRQRLFPVESLPSLTIRSRVDVPVGAWIEGDEVTVIAQDGYLDVNGRFRIVSDDVKVSKTGSEDVSLTFAGVETFA